MTINQEAPVVQSKEIMINATAKSIWNTLTNIEDWPRWNKRISQSIVSHPLEVGSTFRWKTNGSNITSNIHTFSIDQQLGWTGKTFGASAIHNWYLEPTLNGTIVKVAESMEGWLIVLMKKKINTILEDDLTYWLNQLKVTCEEDNRFNFNSKFDFHEPI